MARGRQKRLRALARVVENAIDLACERGCSLRRKYYRRHDAIDLDRIDSKAFCVQRAGEIAGTLLAGKVKEPCRRREPRGDEISEILDIARSRSDVGKALLTCCLRGTIADRENRHV